MARDNEETFYRKCLGQQPNFPNLSQEDFMNCSNGGFVNRVETLTNHVAEEATRIYKIARY